MAIFTRTMLAAPSYWCVAENNHAPLCIDKVSRKLENLKMNREQLQQRVSELEGELLEREKDLALFREELARTNKKLEVLIMNLSHEIRTAHIIQKALVPTQIPTISGFEFSTKFISSLNSGGDYFDIFEHDDRSRFGMIIASSSSHGMSALLISVLLKLTGQMEARRGSEPAKLLKNITEQLVPHIDKTSYTDLFYGLMDRKNYEFSFCKAGKIIALRYDYENSKLELLEATSGPIDARYSYTNLSRKFILNPRDRLIICTRGLIEEKNVDGESYGQERLFETVLGSVLKEAHELRNEILFQIQQFTGGLEPIRDLSVVVTEVNDRVIRLAQ